LLASVCGYLKHLGEGKLLRGKGELTNQKHYRIWKLGGQKGLKGVPHRALTKWSGEIGAGQIP